MGYSWSRYYIYIYIYICWGKICLQITNKRRSLQKILNWIFVTLETILKFTKNQRPTLIRDAVLVSSNNSKKIEWSLAKVIELCPSKGGHIRQVKLKMKDSEFFRPVLRLIHLEVTHDSCEDIYYTIYQEFQSLMSNSILKTLSQWLFLMSQFQWRYQMNRFQWLNLVDQ